MSTKKEYSNGKVTVVWEAKKCVHSGICAMGLPKVFRPRLRPWVRIEEADTDAIVNQVKKCPSGALSYYMNNETKENIATSDTRAEVMENGPLLIHGEIEITHKDGSKELKHKTTAFCRCGASENKPFCDGAHTKKGFLG